MIRVRTRRLTVLDVMILVASTGVGLALLRSTLTRWTIVKRGGLSPAAEATLWFCQVVFAYSPLVAAAMVALLAMRLRSPRPSLRRLVRRPGFVACVAVAVGVVFGAGIFVYFVLEASRWTLSQWTWMASFPIGYGVASAWVILAMSGRWRPSADGFDRLGRILGLYWIALVPTFLVMMFLLD